MGRLELDRFILIGLMSFLGIATLFIGVIIYPNYRATYYGMKTDGGLNFPVIMMKPKNILASDNEVKVEIKVNASNIGGRNDRIEKIWIDIVNTEKAETYVHGHLNFSDARSIIGLIKLEYYNETHYRATVLNTRIEYIEICNIAGKTIPLDGVLSYTSGNAHITIIDPHGIKVEIQLSSDIPFRDYSDSLGIYVLDSSDCEVLVRKYYDQQQTKSTDIKGLPPLTNKTDYPWSQPEGLSLYANMVKIRNDYYVSGNRVGLYIILGGWNVTLVSGGQNVFSFVEGSASLCISDLWDEFLSIRSIDVWVDGEYWGRIEFFEFWFFQNPWLVISLVIVISLFLVTAWVRRRTYRIGETHHRP